MFAGGNFLAVTLDSLNDAAESSGDSREAIGGKTDRKGSAKTRISICVRVGKEQFYLPVLLARSGRSNS